MANRLDCIIHDLPHMESRLVGDPVDVLTGDQFDVALDFKIIWSFPLEWKRYYNTARIKEDLPLGWGHTHSYDHRLKFDIEGVLYTDPSGVKHGFNQPADGSDINISKTGVLHRIAPQTYRVKVRGFPECEFYIFDPDQPAQLRKVFRGRTYHELMYSPDGLWNKLIYGTEQLVHIEHDASGRVLALIWRKTLERQGQLLWRAEYDEKGNLITVLDAYNTTQTFAYDTDHRMVRRTDRRGYGFDASYDQDGRCVRSAGEDGMQEVRLRYLPAGRLTVVTKADGGEWQYLYQDEGIAKIIDPYSGITQRIYGADGRLEREIGPMGEVLLEVVDEESAFLRPPFTPPAGMCLPHGDPWFEHIRTLHLPEDAFAWEGYGNLRCRNTIRFPAKGSSWTHQLPQIVVVNIRFAERPEEAAPIKKPIPADRSAPYPKKPIGVPDHPGIKRYDSFGRLLSHTLPTGETCRWQYDPNGNIIRYVDYAGSEWFYEYASWNLCVRETDPLGNMVNYKYNLLEQPIRIKDGGGTSTDHVFDLKERMTKRHRHSELRDHFGYNLSDGLISAVASDGDVRVGFMMGPNRRPDKIMPEDQPERHCTYDDEGRLVAVTAADSEPLTFTYAFLGYFTTDHRNGCGVERSYSALNLVKAVLFGRYATRYDHETKSGQTTIIDPMGGHHVVRQLDLGIFLRQHANGAEEIAQFDSNGRCLAKVRFKRNRTDLAWSRVYKYSPVGTLLSTEDSMYGNSTYMYDPAHRLVGVIDSEGKRNTFAYDSAGNLLIAPGLLGISYSENRLMTANGNRFEYNQRHNIVRELGPDNVKQYEYDAEDRLVSCHIDSTEITFRYDALGRRIAKITPKGETEFIWDGERLASEISPTGALRVYVYADGITPTPFSFIDYESTEAAPTSGQRRYIFSNQIACPVRVEDEDGSVLWSVKIDAYGRAIISPHATIELNLRWPGHYYDSETGLHYNRYRYYSPELGRYIQVDPRDLEGGINVYAYTARPLDEVDVDGLKPCPKKPMLTPADDDEVFLTAKQNADKLAEDMRRALLDSINKDRRAGKNTQALENTTLAAMVILRNRKWEIVITGNRSHNGLPKGVHEVIGDHEYIGYGDTRPSNVTNNHNEWRFKTERENPTTHKITKKETSHTDAEQRGLRTIDCDEKSDGVAYIAPTRTCCPGCKRAITTPTEEGGEKGGWGGSESNISDRGNYGEI